MHQNYGVLSFTDVIVESSNVGAIKIGFKVGTERLGRYVRRFGFGHAVSPDFPGESPGIVWSPEKWTESALASVSMGYQVGVTPLQMVAAIASVANGGERIEPRVVRAIYRDDRRYGVQPKIVQRADQRRHRGDADDHHGRRRRARHGKPAQIPGYTIAGKTGTAAQLINGHYSTTTTTRRSSASCRRAIRPSPSSSCSIRRTGRATTEASSPRRSSSASPKRRCDISASAPRSTRRRPSSSRATPTTDVNVPTSTAADAAGRQPRRGRRAPGPFPTCAASARARRYARW